VGMQKTWQEAAFNGLINHSGSIIICLMTDGNIIEWSPGAEQAFGWRYADVFNQNFFEICRKNNVASPITDLKPLLAGQTLKNIVSIIETKFSNTSLIIQWNTFAVSGQTSYDTYIVLVGTNITPYKKAEEQANKISGFLHNIINNLPHYIVWKDTNSIFLGCNKKFADSVGLTSTQDIVGKTDYDMPWKKEQSDLFVLDDQEVIKNGIPKLSYEETQRQRDGTEIVVLVSKVPMFDKHLHIIGILCIYTDITERKKAEQKLKQAKEEAERANNIKTDFVHNMQHDIRTPFIGIAGMAGLLANVETDPQKKEYLTDIEQCADELLEYCNSILDFSRIEAGGLAVTEQRFELRELLYSILDMEKPAANFKELDLTLELDDNLPKIVIGDRYRLQRILINLLSNAIKFTERGSVTLTAKVINRSDSRRTLLQFIISDTGIGIPADKQQMIYEKFFRVTPSNKNIFKGQGLGLHIVKQFMDEMDGDIDVNSKVDKGSSFICTIPFKLPHSDKLIHDDNPKFVAL
jgi:two-component system, OmpR family, aerobic respiration control sensor histidine kinase ArcB